MSRHRALSIDDDDDYSDDYNDEYGSSYEGSYGASPSMSQYMYNRNKDSKTSLSTLITKPKTPQDDKKLVAECIEYIERYVEKGVFSRDDMVFAIRRNNYNSEAALDDLFEQQDQQEEPPVVVAPSIQIKPAKKNNNKNNKSNANKSKQNQKKQTQQPKASETSNVNTTTQKDHDIPDAVLMKSLGRGVPLSQGRGASSAARGSLSQSRGRGSLSLGRGRGRGTVLNISHPILSQDSSSEEEGESENEEQNEDDDVQSEEQVDTSSDEEQEQANVDHSKKQQSSSLSPNISSISEEDSDNENLMFVQTKPSALAQCLIRQLTDTSFIYSFLHNKQLAVLDAIPDEIFKFDEPSPDDIALAARDQSKISHKTEFKPIVKKDAGKNTAKSGLSQQLEDKKENATVDTKKEKDDIKEEHPVVIHAKAKGVAPKDESKTRINVVIIGHVDAGKSTLMGHLLYQAGMISDKIIHKYKKESQQIGKASFAFAWVLDEHPEERDRGVTIDVGVRYFDTPNRHVTILDAPGHRDFIPNMITGAAQADMAILVVDSSLGGFESGFQNGGQTKEHLILARSLGINDVVVVVNKLDSVEWSPQRYDEIKEKVGQFAKQIGFKADNVSYIPCSGLTGINLQERASISSTNNKNKEIAAESAKLARWYNGPSLIDYLDQFNPSNRDVDKSFRLSINDVYKTLQTGVTVAGRVDTGHVTVDEQLLIAPLNELCIVKAIYRHKELVPVAYAGDNVELALSKIDQSMLSVGQILCEPSNPIKTTKRFEARIVTFEMDVPITKGSQVVLHTHNVNFPAVISKLKYTLNRQQEITKKRPRVLTNNTTAIVEVKLADKSQAICLEKYSDFPNLGRFMLRSSGKTIAAGIVTDLIAKKKKEKTA